MPYVPSGGQVYLSKRALDMMEKKKNWAFATPEEMMVPGLTPEEMSGLPDDPLDSKKKLSSSSVERFYQQLSNKDKDSKIRDSLSRSNAELSWTGGMDGKPSDDDHWDGNVEPVTRRLNENQQGSLATLLIPKSAGSKSGFAAPTDGIQFSDLVKNDSEDAPDSFSKRAKAEAQQVKDFKTAMGWDVAPAAPPVAVASPKDDLLGGSSSFSSSSSSAYGSGMQPLLGGGGGPQPAFASSAFNSAFPPASSPEAMPPISPFPVARPTTPTYTAPSLLLPRRVFP